MGKKTKIPNKVKHMLGGREKSKKCTMHILPDSLFEFKLEMTFSKIPFPDYGPIQQK